MRSTILRKVIQVIQSTKNQEQLLNAKNYINLYYKIHGTKNKWIIDSYVKNKKNNYN